MTCAAGTQLEIFPDRANPEPDASRGGTLFYDTPVTRVLNPPESTGFPFWSLNPYVGCEFGCSYCYARYAHGYAVERGVEAGRIVEEDLSEFDLEPWRAFEKRILVKRRASVARSLTRDLPKVMARGEPVAIGTATDPYQPAERRFGITRCVLELLASFSGLEIGVVTKSPMVCRDIELLREVDRKNAVTVRISIISADHDLVRKLEERSPTPTARLKALKKLTGAGIRAGLIVAPILPGVTDSERSLDELLRGAADSGAHFVNPVSLRLYRGIRGQLLSRLERHFPGVAETYLDTYGDSRHVPRDYDVELKERIESLAGRYGLSIESDLRRDPRSPSA